MSAATSYDGDILADIYETAHIPELWPRLLDRLSGLSSGWGGMLFTATSDTTRWTASDATTSFFDSFLANGWMDCNPLVERGVRRDHAGFLTDLDLFTPEELDTEPMYADMRRLGGGWHLGTAIAVPNGDTLVVNIERRYEQGPFTRDQAEHLDLYRPHLARAALLAARYTQRRFETTVGDLEALGLPAAALSFQAQVLTANPGFTRLMPRMFQDGPSGLVVRHKPALRRLLDFLEVARANPHDSTGASIPIPATDECAPGILHLVPILGQARDVFARSACLAVMTTVGGIHVPEARIVQGLFDLTPAEARTAREIALGVGVPQIAARFGLSAETIRSQLKAVYHKTGTARQSELTALLNGNTLQSTPSAANAGIRSKSV